MEKQSEQEEFQSKWSAADLCLPIYLDQQIVFDMLAVLEDGLVNVSQVRNTSGQSDSKGNSVNASFGARVVDFFNISIGGTHHVEETDTQQKEICETKTYTAASLFCRLRKQLKQEGLVYEIKEANQLCALSSGSFVEIQVRLEKSPVVEILDRIFKIMEMAIVFQNPSTTQPVSQRGKTGSSPRNPTPDPQEKKFQQFKNFHEQMTESDSIEIIGNSVLTPKITVVVSMNRNSFVKSESEFIGNVFSIFGKAAYVIPPDENDSINLLSRTPLASIDASQIQKIFSTIEGAREMGIVLPDVVTEVKGPALQIIPIAVFL